MKVGFQQFISEKKGKKKKNQSSGQQCFISNTCQASSWEFEKWMWECDNRLEGLKEKKYFHSVRGTILFSKLLLLSEAENFFWLALNIVKFLQWNVKWLQIA